MFGIFETLPRKETGANNKRVANPHGNRGHADRDRQAV